MNRLIRATCVAICAGALVAGGLAQAHHSYAMFDSSTTRTVKGTVAKLEWKNPHTFLWIYVPKPDGARGYDLWGFENGAPSVLSARGWKPEAFKAGDPITVEYWPLRSGKPGGHFEKATFADGRTLVGAGGPGRF